MKWRKMGLIHAADGEQTWSATHASLPTPLRIADDRLRIYFGTRSSQNESSIGSVDVDPRQPSTILAVGAEPVLSPGQIGAFDDAGVAPYSVVRVGGRTLMYYGGLNVGTSVPYRNAIGLAASGDGGRTFERAFPGPVVDRNQLEPFFTSAADVIVEDGLWRMWYGSTTEWLMVDGHPEPRYQIKYGESSDGIKWMRKNEVSIEYLSDGEANVRPCVIHEGGRYRMWYCFRGSVAFRTDPAQSYRLGYAESVDGRTWTRMDDSVGIDRSEGGWDSEMICYPYVYDCDGVRYLLYNGNGFGRTGFGYAILEEE